MFFCIIFYCGASAAVSSDCPKPLTLGWDLWEPYQYLDEGQKPTGLDIELVSAIVEQMGCSLAIAQMPWKQHIKAIENGSVDLAAGASKSPEREIFAFFTLPYREESIALYLRATDFGKYSPYDLEGLFESGFRLGVTRGYYYGPYYAALEKQPFFRHLISEVNYYALNYQKLLDERIDGFLDDTVSTEYSLQKERLTGKIRRHPMIIHQNPIYIMVSKKALPLQLVNRLNEGLEEIKKTGKYKKVLSKYTLLP